MRFAVDLAVVFCSSSVSRATAKSPDTSLCRKRCVPPRSPRHRPLCTARRSIPPAVGASAQVDRVAAPPSTSIQSMSRVACYAQPSRPQSPAREYSETSTYACRPLTRVPSARGHFAPALPSSSSDHIPCEAHLLCEAHRIRSARAGPRVAPRSHHDPATGPYQLLLADIKHGEHPVFGCR